MVVRVWALAVLTAMSLMGADEIALIKSIQGDVTLKRGAEIVSLHKGGVVFENDIIQTGEKGMIGLSFNDGTLISIGPKSVLVVDTYLFAPSQKKFAFDLTLHKGTAAFESGRIGKLAPEKVHFKTSQGIVGIRGTKFVVEVE
ncbi:FecR family protein [Sulfuricurvum sp.]|uniref:FecR family protein n=1 Tax=Sulfuricurvum sp. TaxID=2025608 RepID=UPI002E34D0D2|nr:FecR domain-containing protein [Sulfuricurvum sp.]HEX5330491.1 FecR domain-containing protein [Sulfuricurvum sp.]